MGTVDSGVGMELTDRPIRYRVMVGTFYSDSPMVLQVGEGYVDEAQVFQCLNVKNVALTQEETLRIMAGVPGSDDPSSRYADMTAIMAKVLIDKGAIDAPLV